MSKHRSNVEKEFETYIDNLNTVVWWYKNGDNGNKYFAIPYYDEDENKYKMFYTDYIVKFEKSTGIYDTKSGLTRKIAGPKNKALHEYLSSRPNLKGGIVCKSGIIWKVSDAQYNSNVSKWNNF